MFGRYRVREFHVGDDVIQIAAPRKLASEGHGVSADALALFGMVWPASERLAQALLDLEVAEQRVLDIGCGLGLVSLSLNARAANVTALDIHPLAGELLAANVARNRQKAIPFHCRSWGDASLGKFDLVVASDVLYEPWHIQHLAGCIDRHSHSDTRVVIAEPNRGQEQQFVVAMTRLGFSECKTESVLQGGVQLLHFEREQEGIDGP